MHLQRVVPVPLLCRLDEEGEPYVVRPEKVYEEQNHDDERDGSHAAVANASSSPPGQQAAHFAAGGARRALARLDPGILSPGLYFDGDKRDPEGEMFRDVGEVSFNSKPAGEEEPDQVLEDGISSDALLTGMTTSLRQPMGAVRHRA